MANKSVKNILKNDHQAKFRDLWRMVGNTPLIEIRYRYKRKYNRIYAKCEHYNLTGSVKDRIALFILEKSYKVGKIKEGDTIIEATSGNTGISFSAIGRALGHEVKILMPDWLSNERVQIIKSLGAEIILVSKEEGGFRGCIDMAEAMSKSGNNIFLPRQFENLLNVDAHFHTTGKEIWMQLQKRLLIPNAFIAGVGTGGTVMGTGNFLRKMNSAVKVHPLEPAESPTLTTGYKIGKHRIQGISDEFVPEILKLKQLDDIVQVHDGDAILMARMLAKQLGLGVGISSGANIAGAIKIKERMGDESVVVTMLPDSNKKYLSTDLMEEEEMREGYMAGEVEFLDYRPL